MIEKKQFYQLLKETDEIAEKYNSGCNRYFISKLYTEGIRRDFNLITKYLDKNSRVLDFGCGSGYFAVLLSKFFKECHGVDINLQVNKIHGCNSIEDARNLDLLNRNIWREYEKKYGVFFKDYDGRKLPYQDNYFDGLTMYGVIEHITDDLTEIAVKELFRILKPNGFLFIFKAPRDQSYAEKIIRSHEKLMNEKEFFFLLRKSGFEIVKFCRADFFPEFLTCATHKNAKRESQREGVF